MELSKREKEVLVYASEGLTSGAIAEQMGISRHAVNGYSGNIYRKLGCRNRAEALMWAINNGVIKREAADGE